MKCDPVGIEGCYKLELTCAADERGSFIKLFHSGSFAELGLRCDFREEYCSWSHKDVIRGMHFQVPPMDHAKVVYCLSGSVLDVVLDLRNGSLTYGQYRAFQLTGERPVGIYIPSGVAHGFMSTSASSLMMYKVTSVHSPQHDAGVAFDSFGFEWPVAKPIVSARDQRHPRMAEFGSPFNWTAGDVA